MKVLQKIFYNIIGNSRLPMLVLDKQNQNVDRNKFNASAAAISGFSIFANKIVYILDQKDNIDYKKLNTFLSENKDNQFLIFGFTYNVYNYLIKKINRLQLNSVLKKKLALKNIRNYYGLVEQIGSIFFECKCGYFIASNYSDIIIRDENLKISKKGEKGLVQLLSLLPTSYPGHSILTEDIGEIVHDEKCKCFGHGKRFLIHGRLQNAELRGCSNI